MKVIKRRLKTSEEDETELAAGAAAIRGLR
jgi:hypothetical protein